MISEIPQHRSIFVINDRSQNQLQQSRQNESVSFGGRYQSSNNNNNQQHQQQHQRTPAIFNNESFRNFERNSSAFQGQNLSSTGGMNRPASPGGASKVSTFCVTWTLFDFRNLL